MDDIPVCHVRVTEDRSYRDEVVEITFLDGPLVGRKVSVLLAVSEED